MVKRAAASFRLMPDRPDTSDQNWLMSLQELPAGELPGDFPKAVM